MYVFERKEKIGKGKLVELLKKRKEEIENCKRFLIEQNEEDFQECKKKFLLFLYYF